MNGLKMVLEWPIYIDDSFKYDDISNEWLTIFDYIITNGEYDYDFDRDKIISIGK